MKKRSRKLPLLIGGILVFALAAGFGLFWVRSKQEPKNEDFSLPEKTRAVIHFSTATPPTALFGSKPQSRIFVYDDRGKLLKTMTAGEEVCGPFMVKGTEGLAFLFKDSTVLAQKSQAERLESEDSIAFDAINFGPSQCGYLQDLQTAYSLLNVGGGANGAYTNVIRFVSKTQSYDLAVPYYLEDVVYDRQNRQMLCIIHNTELDAEVELAYLIAKYDADTGRFVLNGKDHFVMTEAPLNIHYRKSMVHENKLYSAVYRDTAEYMADEDKNRTACDLVLCRYDLTTDTKEPEKVLLENFDLNKTGGDLMLSGSNQLPMCAANDSLYVFLKTNEVWVIDRQGEITKKDFPFSFQDTLNLKNPAAGEPAKDFFGSEIKVSADGEILVLNLYRDGMFRIHRLCGDGAYELVWEGALPEGIPQNMVVNDFELLE